MHQAWQAALLAVLIALPCRATIIRVDVNGGGDYLTIGEGIAAADVGDTVLVAQGTYTGPLNRGITIHEGGVYLVSEDGPETTIVDGEYEGRIFYVEPYGTIIEGFAITRGGGGDGSAIRCYSGVTIRNCIITENAGMAVKHYGLVENDWLIVEGCLFTRNGAGIGTFAPSSFTDCTFLENDDYGIRPGGADWHFATTCNVERSTFRANGGRGIRSRYAGGTISHCVFTENGDGALSMDETYTNVSHCTIVQNCSPTGATVYALGDWHGSGCTISNSIIAFNECVGVIDGCLETTVTHNIVFGNAGGDSLCGDYYSNLFADPRLCDIYGGDVSPCADSPAIDWGVGAYDEAGCDACGTPVTRSSWGRLKALYR